MGNRKRQRLTGMPRGIQLRIATAQQTRKQSIAVRNRQQKVRDMLLQGVGSQELMAARLGCSQPTISNDIRAIFRNWLQEDVETTRERAAYRIRQCGLGANESYNAFQRSKQSVEQVTTDYVRVTCPTCSGKSNGKVCQTCEGSGTILQENVTRKMTGQAGDSSHMSNYLRFVREMCKLEGLYVKPPKQSVHQHLHVEIDWDRVPAEQLLRLRSEYGKMQEFMNKPVEAQSQPVLEETELEDTTDAEEST